MKGSSAFPMDGDYFMLRVHSGHVGGHRLGPVRSVEMPVLVPVLSTPNTQAHTLHHTCKINGLLSHLVFAKTSCWFCDYVPILEIRTLKHREITQAEEYHLYSPWSETR